MKDQSYVDPINYGLYANCGPILNKAKNVVSFGEQNLAVLEKFRLCSKTKQIRILLSSLSIKMQHYERYPNPGLCMVLRDSAVTTEQEIWKSAYVL